MMLFTKAITTKLLANGRQQQPVRRNDDEIDFEPVVKLFAQWSNATWPLTEIDPDKSDLAFGLRDLGMGFPELGSVSMIELTSVACPFGLRVERDLHFAPKKTLSAYAS